MAETNGIINGVQNGIQNGISADDSNGVPNGSSDVTPVNKPKKFKADVADKNVKSKGVNGNLADGPDLQFLQSLTSMIMKDGLVEARSRENKVCEFRQPADLKAILSCLPITEESASDQELLDACKDFIKYSVKSTHPRFYNQLFGGMDQYAVGGAWLTEAINTSAYTYEVSPVFTLMEAEVYQKMLGLVGFDGGEAIFCPGGSISNIYAVNVARYRKYPDVKTKGLCVLQKQLCIFTSEKGHYSMKKAAGFLGLGTECVFSVKTDDKGRLIPKDLEKQIDKAAAEGYEPFFVNATSGTTVFGAYDPLEEIAEICSRHSLWLHVDGAWGASVVCSRNYRYLMKGIERADSLTWNPHKMMGVPLQCSMFLTKHKDILKDCHCAHARYLFQQDKHYDVSYDTGDMSIQCGRKVDVLKLWLLWKSKGDLGMERDIDHLFTISRYLAKKLKTTAGYRLIMEPACTNVCFWYIPPSLRGQEETKEWWGKVGKVAPVIKARMMKYGSLMIGYNPDGNLVNFFRMVVSNFDVTTEDMDFLVKEIDRLGKDL